MVSASTSVIELEYPFSEADRQACDALPIGDPQALATTLAACGVEVTTDPDIVSGYLTDSSNLPGAATILARPVDVRECAIVLRACQASRTCVTVCAGRSNLTGSATPPDGVVLSMEKLATPAVTLDAEGLTVTTHPAILLEDLRRAVSAASDGALMFPVDPTSRGDAMLGGALACNASGFTPGEAGAIRAWVQGIDLLLPHGGLIHATRGQYVSRAGAFTFQRDGAAVDWPVPDYPRPAIKNAGGPFSDPSGRIDLVDLIVGSEGLFGVITACTLRLAPQPTGYLDLFISLPDEAQALAIQRQTIADLGGDLSSLAAFEYFGVNCRAFMKHANRFFHGEDQVALYIQEPLTGKDESALIEVWLDRIDRSGAAVDEDGMLMLDTAALRELFLEARHSMPAGALEVVRHRGTFTIMTDTAVPDARFAAFLDFTHQRLAADKLEYLSFGHFGDSHLHFTLLPHPDQIDAGVQAYDAIVAKAAELGGVYSGEHGTGKRKRKDFLRCYGQSALDAVRRCKVAVDPAFVLNRGNVIDADAS